MKFLADMGISKKCVLWLRRKGYDVIHLSEQGLQRMTDKDIYQKAALEGRIILTIDLDFSNIAAFSKAKLPSVIIFRLSNESGENVINHLSPLIERYCKELTDGTIVSVEDKKARLRKLPINRKHN
jgi:predicted nuclease of predicted toxin-antitoxin system